MTLVEAMTATILAVGATLVAGTVMVNQQKSTHQAQMRAELEGSFVQLTQVLGQASRCTAALKNQLAEGEISVAVAGQFTVKSQTKLGVWSIGPVRIRKESEVLAQVDTGLPLWFASLEFSASLPSGGAPRNFAFPLAVELDKTGADAKIVRCFSREAIAQSCPANEYIQRMAPGTGLTCAPIADSGLNLNCGVGLLMVGITVDGKAVCVSPGATPGRTAATRTFAGTPPPPPPPPGTVSLSGADFPVPGLHSFQVPVGIGAGKKLNFKISGGGGGGGGGHKETGGGGEGSSGLEFTVPVSGGEVFQIRVGMGGFCPDNEKPGSAGGLSSVSGPGVPGGMAVAPGGGGGRVDARKGNCAKNDPVTNGKPAPFGWDPGGQGGGGPPGGGGRPTGAPGKFGSGGGGGCDNAKGGFGGDGRVLITPQ